MIKNLSIVGIHRLILNVCVCLHKLISFFFIDLIIWIPLKMLKMVFLYNSSTAIIHKVNLTVAVVHVGCLQTRRLVV